MIRLIISMDDIKEKFNIPKDYKCLYGHLNQIISDSWIRDADLSEPDNVVFIFSNVEIEWGDFNKNDL